MKLNIKRTVLNSALQKVNSIISTRSTLQVLSNVLIEAEDSKLSLTTTDLDIRITAILEADILEEGKTTLPAKKFYEIVKELSGEEVELENENNHMAIKCGHSVFKLLGLPADDFPLPMKIAPIRSFSMEQMELSRMINLISYSVSQDDTRKALSGVLFSISDKNFTSVATDGRRLALVEKTMDDFYGEDGSVILPIKSATELCRLLEKEGNVKVEIGENIINFTLDNGVVMTSKLIDENYPNYKQVIPVSFTRKIEIPREAFTAVLRRVSLVVSEKNFFVKLRFADNKIEFNALSTDVGEGSDYIEIDYTGAEITVSFNPVFLLEPLSRMDCDTVVFKMNEGYSPVAVSNEDGFLYVIMPMRKK
ncbi:MAG: DNA polymerase III subunit beta [Victivallales bacterium]|nr:DNA polymerase III subunit beta [Victivallales bacterium]MCF7889483.1 DNA polymerase III subunit beta [Victivallales bacterium]